MLGNSHLNRRLLVTLFLVLSLSSAALLTVVFSAYQLQLRDERATTSQEVNEVLQLALENAMLKRDLQGLQSILDNMARQDSISQVSIIKRNGEIRFSSNHDLLNQFIQTPMETLCPGCFGDFANAQVSVASITLDDGREVLRSVNPVLNRKECFECHGSVEDNQVNGILIVDYDGTSIKSKAMSGIGSLVFAGLIVILLTIITAWFYVQRNILQPVSELSDVSKRLSDGDLSARATESGQGELSQLGKTFNTMASNLESNLQTINKNKEYLQTLIDANPDGIRVIDKNFKIQKYNNAYSRMLGEENAQRQYCYASSHNRSTPCVPTLSSCPLHEVSKNGKAMKTVQTFHGENGNTFNTQVYSAPLNTQSGDTVIVQSIRDMRHDVKYSHEQRLASLGQLAAGVGHEILNPLTSIRLALQSTLNNLRDKSGSRDDSIEYLELVDGEIDRCIDVTNRLRKLAVLPDDHLQVVSINTSIEETASLLKFEAEQNEVTIELDLSSLNPRIYASESNIRTVVLNLIQNAYHAMPDGGTLSITSRLDSKKQQVTLSFTDNGVGIKDSDMPHIFDPFFSSRANGKGMGLGLSICLSIVNQHHGRILVHSKVAKSGSYRTTFKVVLPEAV